MTKTFLNQQKNVKNTHSKYKKIIQSRLLNFSNTKLSKSQTNILLRALKVTPIAKSNTIQLTCDYKTFVHKLRLIEYFEDHSVTPFDQSSESLIKDKSNFYYPRKRNEKLVSVINCILQMRNQTKRAIFY